MPALLNARREQFCLNYVACGNATKAAEEAGYSKKAANETGARLLAIASVRARIDELMAEVKSRKIADTTEVLEFLTSVIRDEVQEDIVVVEGFQTRVVQKRLGGRERVKSAELLAKRHGLLTDNIKLDAPIPVVITGGDRLED